MYVLRPHARVTSTRCACGAYLRGCTREASTNRIRRPRIRFAARSRFASLRGFNRWDHQQMLTREPPRRRRRRRNLTSTHPAAPRWLYRRELHPQLGLGARLRHRESSSLALRTSRVGLAMMSTSPVASRDPALRHHHSSGVVRRDHHLRRGGSRAPAAGRRTSSPRCLLHRLHRRLVLLHLLPPPPMQIQSAKIVASDGAAFDYLGTSVSLSGVSLAVGA